MFLQLSQLSKAYGGVRALQDVSFAVAEGEVHGLVGENGAGKSTVIKCLSGVVRPDRGRISWHGKQLELGSVSASERAGIAVIHQESTAFPDLDTVDNIFVGRELRKWGGYGLDRRRMEEEARRLIARLQQQFDIRQKVGTLSVAQRQMVSMARALSQDCRFLIMDEPTASLSVRETTTLLEIVRSLRAEGVSVLYVSHRLEEIFQLSDRVTVLRDGQFVGTENTESLDREKLISMMIGKAEAISTFPASGGRGGGAVRLRVSGLTAEPGFQNISFVVRSGEIVGLAGLVGAGRSEVARAIFGIDRYTAGWVAVDGRPLRGGRVAEAIRAGVGLVPEDRQHEGLVLPMTVAENLSLVVLSRLARAGFTSRARERAVVEQMIDRLSVKTAHRQAGADTLSGGNQQKLVLGKWLAARPKVLMLDEPTRGVDVRAKQQVHDLIAELAAEGIATLVISSEMSELQAICDRILVMREGRLSGELGPEATQEELLTLALPE